MDRANVCSRRRSDSTVKSPVTICSPGCGLRRQEKNLSFTLILAPHSCQCSACDLLQRVTCSLRAELFSYSPYIMIAFPFFIWLGIKLRRVFEYTHRYISTDICCCSRFLRNNIQKLEGHCDLFIGVLMFSPSRYVDDPSDIA